MVEKIEKAVQITSEKDGYSVGEKDSYADVVIFSLLRDCGMDSDKDDTLKAAKACTLLMGIADRIAADSKVSKWVEERPVSMF